MLTQAVAAHQDSVFASVSGHRCPEAKPHLTGLFKRFQVSFVGED